MRMAKRDREMTIRSNLGLAPTWHMCCALSCSLTKPTPPSPILMLRAHVVCLCICFVVWQTRLSLFHAESSCCVIPHFFCGLANPALLFPLCCQTLALIGLLGTKTHPCGHVMDAAVVNDGWLLEVKTRCSNTCPRHTNVFWDLAEQT